MPENPYTVYDEVVPESLRRHVENALANKKGIVVRDGHEVDFETFCRSLVLAAYGWEQSHE